MKGPTNVMDKVTWQHKEQTSLLELAGCRRPFKC